MLSRDVQVTLMILLEVFLLDVSVVVHEAC